MTEIRFYHLQTQTQEQALPLLLSKAVERGMRVVLKLRDDGEVERMNETLWTFTPDSFLPHGSKKDGKAEHQPVWLTATDENPNKATVLFAGQGVQSETPENFELCCEILDGRDDSSISAARERWKTYKEKGFTVTYWQQTERGGWEQKA
jgi:DNA polymerase-3 subunit chi